MPQIYLYPDNGVWVAEMWNTGISPALGFEHSPVAEDDVWLIPTAFDTTMNANTVIERIRELNPTAIVDHFPSKEACFAG